MSAAIRNYHDDDIQAIAELRKAAAAVDQTKDGIVVTEPPADPVCTTTEPHRDIYVAQDDRGQIVGTAQLQVMSGPERGFVWSFPVVHPDWRGTAAERLLLERLWERGCELRHTMRSAVVYFYVHCAPWEEERVALCESFGLRVLRARPHMIYEPLTNLARPDIPPGIDLRPYARGTDDPSSLRTLNEAFADDWEYTPVTKKEWSTWLDSPHWRADLNLVAVEADQVVGLCLGIISEQRIQWLGRKDGYVDTLCVRPSHQRRGLGTALLLTGLHALWRAGMESATLDTDEDNPTQAPRFYEGVGFREIWRWTAYGKHLRRRT
jgi:mycothiol synthase